MFEPLLILIIIVFLVFSFDLLGQNLFKVPEGDGFVMFVAIILWGIGPILGLIGIAQGKIDGPPALVGGVVYLAILKFIWWDNFRGSRDRKTPPPPSSHRSTTSSDLRNRYEASSEVTHKPTALIGQNSSSKKSKKWSFNVSTKILKNNDTGTEYSPKQYERVSEGVTGYQIIHGPDVWVNDWDIDTV